MSIEEPSTDVIRRVYADSSHFVEVCPWPDDPKSALELRTIAGEDSDGWFGKISLTLDPKMARELGKALIASANEIEGAA